MATWRSESLPWIALGSIVALMALWRVSENQRPPERQNQYASREACERDYDPTQCRQTSGGGIYGGYYGPRYISDTATRNDPGPGRTAENGRSLAASSVHGASTRGGFGATGRGYSGGYG
jgi:hypothetical protein